jgi:hypothetical protein
MVFGLLVLRRRAHQNHSPQKKNFRVGYSLSLCLCFALSIRVVTKP